MTTNALETYNEITLLQVAAKYIPIVGHRVTCWIGTMWYLSIKTHLKTLLGKYLILGVPMSWAESNII